MILIIDCGSSKTKKILNVLDDLEISNEIIRMENMKEIIKDKLSKITGIIISGAPVILTEIDETHYLKKFDFIKKLNIPVLGICFGHQILGLLFGSKIARGSEVRRKQSISFVLNDPLFNNIKNNSKFIEDRCECISLPKNFILLAKSETCNNEAMKHKHKNIYGIQFHPETSGEIGKVIIKNFGNLCGK